MPRNRASNNGEPDDNIIGLGSTESIAVSRNATSQNSIDLDKSKLGALDSAAGNTGSNTLGAYGAESIFNPFAVFRYSEFGAGANGSVPGTYDMSRHKNIYPSIIAANAAAQTAAAIAKSKVQNPTATNILDWTSNRALLGSGDKGPLYPYPYQLNDFLWCKYYGKIPNNRLLTLRRYPIPVEDNLAIASTKLPLVPIAQAVTWWGADTGNSLGEILKATYGFKWRDDTSTIDDVQGNELTIETLLDAAGITDPTTIAALTIAFRESATSNPFALSGYDKTLQDFTKESWEKGAYWNRVMGPVNVIDKTKRRERGYDYTHTITLDFEYSLRSYGTINPKVAMLDLISNFMALTYNRASFWGGGYRYFQQTGALLPGFDTTGMDKGDYTLAAKQVLEMVGGELQAKGSALKEFVEKLLTAAKGKSIEEAATLFTTELANTSAVNDIIASKMGSLHQKPLLFKALLDGRAVGEWHLMIGNPMDPLAVMGNLCLTSTEISFSDELGADDFPTSVKFKVTLDHGRPRAKQDIESMFNHGGGDLSFTALEPPSSAMDSNGEYNSTRIANAYGSGDGGAATALTASIQKSLKALQAGTATDADKAESKAAYFRTSVSNRYGVGFGSSPILVDYFTRLQTKD